MIDKKQYHRSRLNSHSSIDNYSTDNIQQEEEPGEKVREFPLIMKKQNSIQKYINDFKTSEIYSKISRAKKNQDLIHQNSSLSGHTKSIYSATPGIDNQKLKSLEQKCYVKYQSLSLQQSDQKISALHNVQRQYIKLKNSILPQRKQYVVSQLIKKENSKKSLLNAFQKNTGIIKIKKENISYEEVQKQLKTSLVHENGKDYYADLYLMKKQRDTLINTIFRTQKSSTTGSINENVQGMDQTNLNSSAYGEGKIARNGSRLSKNSSNTKFYLGTKTNIDQKNQKKSVTVHLPDFKNYNYDEKMRQQQQKFVQQKILKQRSQKKKKMLKGRNLHWNVYYQMLALGKDQKMKLKQYCKFSNTFGIN